MGETQENRMKSGIKDRQRAYYYYEVNGKHCVCAESERIVKEIGRRKNCKMWLCVMLFFVLLSAGCSIEQSNRTKVSELEYTIVPEEEIPEELGAMIKEKKAADFKMTFSDDQFLYIVRGYGEQETGGYSICIRDLYLTSNAILFYTELIGPRKGETIGKSPSFPYIVVRTALRDEHVVFE